jgi:hypothetical protein
MQLWTTVALGLVASSLVACSENPPTAGADSSSSSNESSSSSSSSTTPPTTTATTASTSATSATTTPGTSGNVDSSGSSESSGGPPTNVGKGEVRFVALGDAGEGNEAQIAVGATIASVCEERGCDFALYLGDNFYDVGVDSPMDAQFQAKFEVPYAPIDFPFYITLGNHDYGLLGNDWSKADHQIEYSTISEKWTLPSQYYSFQQENAHFISLDTSQLFWDHEIDAQRAFVAQDLAKVEDSWIIMFGHHPYLSNGEHGNAGSYEGLGGIIGGETVQDFFEQEVCGQAHVYICGHDHNKQWLLSQCGTEFIVSGGGAKLTDFVHRDDNPTHWEDDQTEGFLWVEIIDDTFTGVFYDRDGNPQYERTLVL